MTRCTHSHAHTQEAAHFLREADGRLGSIQSPRAAPSLCCPRQAPSREVTLCTQGVGADEQVSAQGLA